MLIVLRTSMMTTEAGKFTSTNSFFHPSYVDGFKIWFNGKLIHSSKTFAPANKKLMILFEKWSLKFEE